MSSARWHGRFGRGGIRGASMRTGFRREMVKWPLTIAAAALCLTAGAAAGADDLRNARYHVRLVADGVGVIVAGDAAEQRFEPRVSLLFSATDPKPELRWGELGDPKLQNMYNVM